MVNLVPSSELGNQLFNNKRNLLVPKKTTALVFSGAGAKIIVEAGMAKAFVDSGLDYDYVIGTSSGAIVAAALHAKQMDKFLELMMTIKNRDVHRWAGLKVFTEKAYYYNNAPLRKTISNFLDTDAIKENIRDGRECLVNVCDLKTWSDMNIIFNEEMTHDEIVESIIASTAVPCAFPYEHGVCDGGIVENYGLFDALAQNVDRVIMFVTTTKNPGKVHNIKDMLGEMISLMLYNQFQTAMRAVELFKSTTEIHVVQVPHTPNIPLLDFNKMGSKKQREEYIAMGYDCAMSVLSTLKE